jgi:hypothetical protein
MGFLFHAWFLGCWMKESTRKRRSQPDFAFDTRYIPFAHFGPYQRIREYYEDFHLLVDNPGDCRPS